MNKKYFLKADFQTEWTEVSKAMWIQAERDAGFRPKCAHDDPKYMTTEATGGFTGGCISGRIEYITAL